MRIVSAIFFVLAGVTAALAVGFYVWIHGMACAFSNAQNTCRIKAPWALGSEDFLLLVVLPLGIVAVLVGLGWLARGKARSDGTGRSRSD